MQAPTLIVKKSPAKTVVPVVRKALPTDIVNIYKVLVADELNAGIERKHSPAERIDHILNVVSSGFAVVVELSGRIIGTIGFCGTRTQGDDKSTLVSNGGVGWVFFAQQVSRALMDQALEMCTKFADSHDVEMNLGLTYDTPFEEFLAGPPGSLNSGQQGFVQVGVEYRRAALSEDAERADNDPEFDSFPDIEFPAPGENVKGTGPEPAGKQVTADDDDETIISDADAEAEVANYTEKLSTQQGKPTLHLPTGTRKVFAAGDGVALNSAAHPTKKRKTRPNVKLRAKA